MRAVSLPEIYLLTGMGLGVAVALMAARGLGPRRLALCGLAIVGALLLITVVVRLAPLSLGLPLTGGAVMLGGFACAFRLFRRARPWLRLLGGAALAGYAAAGVVLLVWGHLPGQSAAIIIQQGLVVLALPMLAGAVAGLWRATA